MCVTFAVTAVLLVCQVSTSPAAARAASEGRGPDKVISRLSLDADRSGRLGVESETVIRAAARDGLVDELLQDPREDWFFREDLPLGSGLGLFDDTSLLPPPTLSRVEAGTVVAVSALERGHVGGGPAFLSPFEIAWRDGMEVRTAKPRSSSDVAWVVILELDEIELGAIRPVPTSLAHDRSRTRLEWRFGPGHAEAIAVGLAPPWAVTAEANIVDGGWSDLRGTLAVILGSLFLPALLLLLGRGGSPYPREPEATLRHQATWLTVAAGFAVLVTLAALLKEQVFRQGWLAGESGFESVMVDVLPALFAAAFAGAIQMAGRSRSSLPTVAYLTAAAAASFVLLLATDPFGPWWRSELSEFLEAPAAVFAVAGWATLVYFMVNGLLRILVGWLGAERPRLDAGRSRRIAQASALLTAALGVAAAVAYLDGTSEWLDQARVVIPIALTNAMYTVMQLMPLAILPGAIGLLGRSSPTAAFLARCRAQWLLVLALYLFFVVTNTGVFAGFSSPWSLVLGAAALGLLAVARFARLEQLDEKLARLNPDAAAAVPGASLLTRRRKELIDRALLIERMQRLRGAEHQKHAKSEEGGEAFVEYRRRLQELDRAEAYLQTGIARGASPSAADRELVRLKFPERPPVVYPALGCGPGRDWRENGQIALRFGALLAVLPIAYLLIVIAKNDLGSIFDPSFGFELLSVISLLGSELALWVVAAYAFGCLFAWLPAGSGALKGFVLSLPVIAGFGLLELCPLYSGAPDWWFRCVEVLAFLSVLGLVMDIRTVRGAGLRGRDLLDLYQVRSVRFGVVNLAPLLLAAFGIYQQIRAGNPQGAVEEALKAAPNQFPGVGGDGG